MRKRVWVAIATCMMFIVLLLTGCANSSSSTEEKVVANGNIIVTSVAVNNGSGEMEVTITNTSTQYPMVVDTAAFTLNL